MPAELYGDRDYCLDHHLPELERLRQEVASLKAEGDDRAEAHQREIDWYDRRRQHAEAEVKQLKAEIDRLRQAGLWHCAGCTAPPDHRERAMSGLP